MALMVAYHQNYLCALRVKQFCFFPHMFWASLPAICSCPYGPAGTIVIYIQPGHIPSFWFFNSTVLIFQIYLAFHYKTGRFCLSWEVRKGLPQVGCQKSQHKRYSINSCRSTLICGALHIRVSSALDIFPWRALIPTQKASCSPASTVFQMWT